MLKNLACIAWLSLLLDTSVWADAPRGVVQNVEQAADGPIEAEARLAADVRFLAADDMRGRGPGTGGLERAAEFIADRWRGLGLETRIFNDSPFQEFQFPGEIKVTKPDRNKLAWLPKIAGEKSASHGSSNAFGPALQLEEDFRPMSVGASVKFDAPLAFAGYGITAKLADLSYDDYASIDVHGKIVVLIRKEPRQADPKSPFDGAKSSRHALFGTKIANAKKRGAVGIIFINDRHSAEAVMVGRSDNALPDNSSPASQSAEKLPGIEDAGKGSPNERLPILFVSRKAIGDLLTRVRPGFSIAQFEADVDADLTPRSFDIPEFRAVGEVFLERTQQRVKNVVACLPGEGSLADETVVIGAHFDHVGMGGPGSLAPGIFEVHNGADDNASGTASLLEVSRRFAVQPSGDPQPRRRVVFIGFTGEERGLLGSRYYVAHPRYALESTVAMLNLDMVGRMSDSQLLVLGTGTADVFDRFIEAANRELGLKLSKQKEGRGPSDHLPFFERRVPVLHFFTGFHEDYHRPSDDFQKINTSGMVAITDIVYRIGSDLAVSPQRPRYIPVQGEANLRIPIERRGRLGVQLGWNDAGDAVEVESVLPGSVAEKAGLQSGDWILGLDGEHISKTELIPLRLSAKNAGESVVLRMQRGSRQFEVEVKLENPK
jgi:hypothetical protein